MPSLLRIISKQKWLAPPWLPSEELPADPLSDLRTSENSLSVWLVSDEESLERVIASLAAKRNKPDKFDYVLIDYDDVGELGITISQEAEETADPEIAPLHHDLVYLTVNTVTALAHLIWERCARERLLPQQIAEMIARAVSKGRIPRDKLAEKIVSYLEKRSLLPS